MRSIYCPQFLEILIKGFITPVFKALGKALGDDCKARAAGTQTHNALISSDHDALSS